MFPVIFHSIKLDDAPIINAKIRIMLSFMEPGFAKVASYGVCENFTLNIIMFYILIALQCFTNLKIIHKLKIKTHN